MKSEEERKNLVGGDGLLGLGLELVDRSCVVAEIELCADEDLGDLGTKVVDLWVPLARHVLKGDGICDGKADEENICVGVTQRTQTVVLFLSGRVPQAELDGLLARRKVHDVVVKHRRDVILGEAVVGVADEEA